MTVIIDAIIKFNILIAWYFTHIEIKRKIIDDRMLLNKMVY